MAKSLFLRNFGDFPVNFCLRDFRFDGAKSPDFPEKEGVLGSEIAARNRKSLATFHRLNRNAALLSLVSEIAAISGVRERHRNRKSQKSLRFRCASSPPHPWPPQGSIWHRFDIDFLIWPYFDAKSTPEKGRARRIRG